MSSLRLKCNSSSSCSEEKCMDLEERINNWLDVQGVQICNPRDKVDDYFYEKKNATIQEQRSTGCSDSDNENEKDHDQDDKLSFRSSKRSSMLLSIGQSPLLKKRLQKKLSFDSPSQSSFKLKQSYSENYEQEENMTTPLRKSRFANNKIFNFEDSE